MFFKKLDQRQTRQQVLLRRPMLRQRRLIIVIKKDFDRLIEERIIDNIRHKDPRVP
jgi:hypothetical protein